MRNEKDIEQIVPWKKVLYYVGSIGLITACISGLIYGKLDDAAKMGIELALCFTTGFLIFLISMDILSYSNNKKSMKGHGKHINLLKP